MIYIKITWYYHLISQYVKPTEIYQSAYNRNKSAGKWDSIDSASFKQAEK